MTELTMQEEIEILKKLGDPLPTAAIQRTKKGITKKGYDTDGYGYQFCVNRFNEILGTHWGYIWEIINEKEGLTEAGKSNVEITVKLGIWILNKEDLRYGVGGHNSRTHFDAVKGGFTNAFKKAASMWGVGRHAYEGALDDDNDPWPEFAQENNLKNGSSVQTTPPVASQQPPQVAPPANGNGEISKMSESQKKAILTLGQKKGFTPEKLEALALKICKVSLESFSSQNASFIIQELQKE